MDEKTIQLLCHALEATTRRGHQMYLLSTKKMVTGQEQITLLCGNGKCDGYVQIIPEPAPNQINVGGTAVALNCPHRSNNVNY